MPDESALVEQGRNVVVLHERVAVVETKVDSLAKDSTVIRSSIHAINNDIQKIFTAEQKCSDALTQLLGLTKDIPSIAAQAGQFSEMRLQLQGVIATRQQQQGAWRAIAIVGTALMGAVTIGSILAGGFFWLFNHIR